MHNSRRGLLSSTVLATLLLASPGTLPLAQAPAPLRPQPFRPAAGPLAPAGWAFANIRVSVLGPNTVRIDWAPLSGADLYRIYRNGAQVGPDYPAALAPSQSFSALDNAAPGAATLSYQVIAFHMTTIYGAPGTPGAGAHAGEGPLQASVSVAVTTPAPAPVLRGFVDLHTHPASYLGFGGKLIYGAVDVGSTLPTGACNPPRATSEFEALGFEYVWYGIATADNRCGDSLRAGTIIALEKLLDAAAYDPASYYVSGPQTRSPNPSHGPMDFPTWPAWNDLLRQKMWIEWIRRAYQGGLRVMVALAVNNRLLGDLTAGGNTAGTDDRAAADKQIAEIIAFVGRHSDFMKIVISSADLYNTVASNKLAVVLGTEIDNIGNFVGPTSSSVLNKEIDRLYNEGVRYILPVHLVDNPIGRTAVYVDLFNVANLYEEGLPWQLGCKAGISYQYRPPTALLAAGSALKLGGRAPGIPPAAPCAAPVGMMVGNVNVGNVTAPEGLTASGKLAVQHMMDLGMLIDVDHMSELSVDDTLTLAERDAPNPYPLFSGHNLVRGALGRTSNLSERFLRADQYARLGRLHGMAGIQSAKATSAEWLQAFQQTLAAMGFPAPSEVPAAGIGTDANGMQFMMPPRAGSNVHLDSGTPASFPVLSPATDGNQTWDYNKVGVANYGLLPDFLADVSSFVGGDVVVRRMFSGAQYFYETWALAEKDMKNLGADNVTTSVVPSPTRK